MIGSKMARLTVLRGMPGSGKSTYARKLPFFHVEADMYHMRDGTYQWKPENVRKAHEWCQETVREALSKGMDVVVSNTFTTLKEIKPYESMPWSEFMVVTMTGSFGNTHDVPQEALDKMKNRWQDYTGETFMNTKGD